MCWDLSACLPEEAETDPAALQPYGQEERGEGHEIHNLETGCWSFSYQSHRLELKDELEEVFGAEGAEEEVEEDDDAEGEVDEEGFVLLPGGAHLHMAEERQLSIAAPPKVSLVREAPK